MVVHVHLARVVVRRRRQAAVRALPKWRLRPMELNPAVWRVVRCLDGGRTRVPVVEFPGGDPASAVDGGLDVDDARRSEVGEPELLATRPDQLHGFAHRPCQPRRFDGELARVLSAVGRARVRNDHPDLRLGNPEGVRELAANAEWPLRAGPDGQLAPGPFGHRRSRFERHVRDVRNAVAGVEGPRRRRPRGRYIACNGWRCVPSAACGSGRLEMLIDRLRRRQVSGDAPRCLHRRCRLAGEPLRRRHHARRTCRRERC